MSEQLKNHENATESNIFEKIMSVVVATLFSVIMTLERAYYKNASALLRTRLGEADYQLKKYEAKLNSHPAHTREGIALTIVLLILGVPSFAIGSYPSWFAIVYIAACILGGFTLGSWLSAHDFERYHGDEKHVKLQARYQRLLRRYNRAQFAFELMILEDDEDADFDWLYQEYGILW